MDTLSQKLLNLADTAKLLGVSQEEVEEFAQRGHIEAYKIGGTYLRFKRDHVEGLRESLSRVKLEPERVGTWKMPEDMVADAPGLPEKLKDFWYFNNFYIISATVIVVLIISILR